MRPGLRHFGVKQLLHAAPFVRYLQLLTADFFCACSSKLEEVDGGRLDSVDLRQLLTAWLDCRNWTEEYIPRIVDLDRFHMLGRTANLEQLRLAAQLHCSAAVLSSLLVHVKTYVDRGEVGPAPRKRGRHRL